MGPVSLQGSLESFKLPEVLSFLDSTHRTGMLTLTTADRETYVFFRAGAVVYAASNHEAFRLGPILIRKKKLTREKAAEIDDLMLRSGGGWGELALQNGVMNQSDLEDYLKVQVSEVIYDAFVWKSGEFSFYDGIDLPPNAVTISIDLSNLIMEGARRIDEWTECLRLLPDSSVVFRVVADPETEKITLSLDEWRILFLINGQRTLEELCRATESEAFQVYRLVYGLVANKLIEPSADDAGERDGQTGPVAQIEEITIRQKLGELTGDATMPDRAGDDTSLLVSEDATLSYKDVVKKTVAQLLIMSGQDAGTVIPLVESEYVVGRQHDNQIQLNDLGVSARHARIFRGPEGFVVEDLKSRNGTWLNGTRIFHSILRNADEIRVGATDLRYEVLFDASNALPPPAGVKAR
jgi:pSer/pThr/pTyr-binding forkhead associated (FHA) protein